MARYLYVTNGIVVNVVDYAVAPIPEPGETILLSISGAENVGDNVMLILGFAQYFKQLALDAYLNTHFDLLGFIRGGSTATLTGTQVGTFLASMSNNYRSKRTAIAAAANAAAATAIDVTAGWPANP